LGNLFSSFETPKEYLLSNGQSREGIGFSKASRRYTAMGPEKDKEICTALESQGLAMLSEQRGPAKECTIVQKITIIIFIKTSQMGLGAAGALLRLMDTYGPATHTPAECRRHRSGWGLEALAESVDRRHDKRGQREQMLPSRCHVR